MADAGRTNIWSAYARKLAGAGREVKARVVGEKFLQKIYKKILDFFVEIWYTGSSGLDLCLRPVEF